MFSFLAQLLLYNKCFTTALVFKWKEFWVWNLTEDDVLTMCGRHGNNMWMTWDDPWDVGWSYVIRRSSACHPHGLGSSPHLHVILIQCQIQDFLQGVRQLPNWDYFANSLLKTAWKWKNLDPRGVHVPGTLLRSANVIISSLEWHWGQHMSSPRSPWGRCEVIHWR